VQFLEEEILLGNQFINRIPPQQDSQVALFARRN
jgi:hypothetical protein